MEGSFEKRANSVLERAKYFVAETKTWADFSNRLFSPRGVVSLAFPDEEERMRFYESIQGTAVHKLLSEVMKRTGTIAGGTPVEEVRRLACVERLMPPVIAIVGHGRSGKDTAAEWLAEHTVLRFAGGCSFAARHYMAQRLGLSPDESYARRHENRDKWFQYLNEFREGDPDRLGEARPGDVGFSCWHTRSRGAACVQGVLD